MVFKLDKIYSRFGLGFGNIDMFMRLGAVEADIDRKENLDNLAGYVGDSDFEFAIGGGTKITFYKEKRIKWGMVAQFAYYKPEYDTQSYSIAGHSATLSAEAEVFELQIAAGPKINLSQGVSIYGGPMFHYVDVDADLKGSIDGSPGTVDTSGDVDSGFGG